LKYLDFFYSGGLPAPIAWLPRPKSAEIPSSRLRAMREDAMAIVTKPAIPPPPQIGRAVGAIIAAVAAKRGFATADLLAAWSEIVGERYADCTQPESIAWPRKAGGEGVLTVRIDGGKAIYLQHELGQLIERINQFLGARAVGSIRLVQKPLQRRASAPADAPAAEPTAAEREAVEAELAGIEDEALRGALRRLGFAIFAAKSPKSEP
jgi:hypothetical protein